MNFMNEMIKLQKEMNALAAIEEWANSSHAYLSNREGYAQRYREGIAQAKEIVLSYINHHRNKPLE